MFLTVLIASLVMVALAFLGLGLNIIFRKNGRFPEHEISSNANMKKMGITCARQDEMNPDKGSSGKPGDKDQKTQPPLRDCGLGCSCAADEL